MSDSAAGPSRLPSTQPLRTTKETHPNLPPGLILDKDGKVCKVCNSWRDWGKVAAKQSSSSSSSGNGKGAVMGGMGGFASMMTGKPNPDISASSNETRRAGGQGEMDRRDCPADTEALGRSTWTFLHTTAAYYPLKAPPATQKQMTNLLSSLSLLYPCVPCAEDFQEKVKENPPDVSGREGLSKWLCERHNEVNEKLGKESFACDWSNLNKRWKDGPDNGSCN